MSPVRNVLLVLILLEVAWWGFTIPSHSLSDEGYFHLRQAENIRSTGFPLVNDELSYGGRNHIILPLYDYFVALISFIANLEVAIKIVNFILIACLIASVFFVAREMAGDVTSALFSAVAFGLLPSILDNMGSSILLGLLFIMILIFFISRTNISNNLLIISIIFVLLLFTNIIYLLLIIGLLLYVFFIKTEEIKHSQGELELILCATLVSVWFSMIIFRNALIFHGVEVLFGNVPEQLQNQFPNTISLVILLGLFPFFLGLYAIFSHIFIKKNKSVYLCVSLLLASFFLTIFSFVSVNDGIVISASLLCVLSSFSWKELIFSIEKTKLSNFKAHLQLLAILMVVLIGIATLQTSANIYNSSILSVSDIDAIKWMSNNIQPSAKVMALYDEGNAIAALSRHPTVGDSSFILIGNSNAITGDQLRFFKTYETDAVKIMNKYNASIIFYSQRAQAQSAKPEFLNNKECFELIYDAGAQIFNSKCRLIAS